MMRDGHSLVAGLADMRGRKVVLVDGYSTVEAISAKYPTIQIILTDSPLHALKSVAEGEVEATVQNLGVATYLIKEHDLTNLNVAAPADLDQPGLSFGVRKDWPELVPLINKVLASITPEEEAAIRAKWGSTQYQIGINIATVRQVMLQAGGAVAVIVIFVLLWNRRLSREVKQRRQAEEQLAEKEAQLRLALDNMPGGMELVDRDRNYVFFNRQYCELHNYPDGLLKVGGSAFDETRFQVERGDFGPGDPDELMAEAHVPFRSGETNSYQRTFPSGRTLQFDVAPTPEGGYVTIATDITERKRAEEELERNQILLDQIFDTTPVPLSITRQTDGCFAPLRAE
jgi:PAS domain-containing protein